MGQESLKLEVLSFITVVLLLTKIGRFSQQTVPYSCRLKYNGITRLLSARAPLLNSLDPDSGKAVIKVTSRSHQGCWLEQSWAWKYQSRFTMFGLLL